MRNQYEGKCLECSISFRRILSPSNLKKGKGKFCSRGCCIRYSIGKKHSPCSEERKMKIGLANSKTKVSKICPTCNNIFLIKPYKANIQICCSKKCRRGELHPCWQGGLTGLSKTIMSSLPYKTWRLNIFKRDNFTCLLCKRKKEVNGILEVDHYPLSKAEIIKMFGIKNYEEALNCEKLWDENNGRTLCRDCHKKTPTYLNRWYNKNI